MAESVASTVMTLTTSTPSLGVDTTSAVSCDEGEHHADACCVVTPSSSGNIYAHHSETIESNAASQTAPKPVLLGVSTLNRLKKVEVYKSRLRILLERSDEEFFNELNLVSNMRALIEELKTLNDHSIVDEVPSALFPFIALIIEGRNEPLQDIIVALKMELDKHLSPHISCSPLALQEAVLRVASRKSVSEESIAKVLGEDNVDSLSRGRWEVEHINLFPAGAVRDCVKRWQKTEKKIRELCMAYVRFLLLSSENVIDESFLEKADETILKHVRGLDKLLAQEDDRKVRHEEKIARAAERERKIAEKEQKTKERFEEIERKKEEREKAKKDAESKKIAHLAKERSLMSSWVQAKKAATTPLKRSQICALFLPWEAAPHVTVAPLFVSSRVDVDEIDTLAFSGIDVVSLFALRMRKARVARTSKSKLYRGSKRKHIKLILLHTERRPAFYGVFAKRKMLLPKPRSPFAEVDAIDYDNDSDQEWESDASDAEDLDNPDGDDGDDMSDDGNRIDGLEDDGWLQPEEMDEDARKQLSAIGGALSFHVIGPIRCHSLFNDQHENEDCSLKTALKPFKALVFADVHEKIVGASIESPISKKHSKAGKKRKLATHVEASDGAPTSGGRPALKQMTIQSLIKKT